MWEKDIITPKGRIRANKKNIYNKNEKLFLCTSLSQENNSRRNNEENCTYYYKQIISTTNTRKMLRRHS